MTSKYSTILKYYLIPIIFVILVLGYTFFYHINGAVARPAGNIQCTNIPFSNVPTNHGFCPEIAWQKSQNIVTGTSYPSPSGNVYRYQASMYLYKQFHPDDPLPACTSDLSLDVSRNDQYCGVAKWMVDEGVIELTNNRFYLSNGVTRADSARYFYILANPGKPFPTCDSTFFPDVPLSHPDCGVIDWMISNGITSGFGDGNYSPSNIVTQQAFAAFQYRYATIIQE